MCIDYTLLLFYFIFFLAHFIFLYNMHGNVHSYSYLDFWSQYNFASHLCVDFFVLLFGTECYLYLRIHIPVNTSKYYHPIPVICTRAYTYMFTFKLCTLNVETETPKEENEKKI